MTLVCKNYNDTISSAWRTRLKTEWDDFHKMYLGKQDPSSFPWTDASNLDLGIVEMCVDNLKSRYKLSTIGATPMFNVIPVTEAGEEFKQRVCDSMVYILDTDIDIDKRLDLIAQRTVEFGTCIAKLFWKKDMIEKVILPLLPYYAEKFGATPAVVGLLGFFLTGERSVFVMLLGLSWLCFLYVAYQVPPVVRAIEQRMVDDFRAQRRQ